MKCLEVLFLSHSPTDQKMEGKIAATYLVVDFESLFFQGEKLYSYPSHF